jgi:uncharacterized protein YggE
MNSLFHISMICFISLVTAPAFAQEISLMARTPHITVTGSAHAEVVPDLAIISFSVVTERPTATAAGSDNATAATAVINEVKAQGIDAKDIRTVSVTLSPVYDDSRDLNGRIIKHTLRGYQARDGFEVRIRALDKAGSLARQLIEKGANNFGGIAFEIEHPEDKQKAMQAEAMKDTLARAQNYAGAIDLKLGHVIEISPDGGSRYLMPKAAVPMAAHARIDDGEAAQASIPVEPGVRTLEASVTVTWEIAQ